MTITLTREEAQQVLDALVSCSGVPHWPSLMPVIKTLRARLSAPEPEREQGDMPCIEDDGCPTEKAVLQRFWRKYQQPEPKPHGYLWFTAHMEQRFTHRKPEERERIGDVKPVYTAPLQREWQDLTKQEFIDVTDGLEDLEDCWIAIQAKLREKNV